MKQLYLDLRSGKTPGKFGKCFKCVHYWAKKSGMVFVAVIDLPPRVPLRDHGSGQSILGRRCDLSCPVCVVIPEHVTSNASDSESSYRKSAAR